MRIKIHVSIHVMAGETTKVVGEGSQNSMLIIMDEG